MSDPNCGKCGHEPAVYSSRHGAWVLCSCGWRSGSFWRAAAASYSWSLHVKAVFGRG